MSIDNINIEKIRSLIELMEEKELLSLEVSAKDEMVKLKRYFEPKTQIISAASAVNTIDSDLDLSVTTTTKQGRFENSPMVGVFYAAPSPNDPPFVKAGQKVQAGDTLGIIEAMKIMNPLEATQTGIVEEVLVDNATVVEFGQPIIKYQS